MITWIPYETHWRANNLIKSSSFEHGIDAKMIFLERMKRKRDKKGGDGEGLHEHFQEDLDIKRKRREMTPEEVVVNVMQFCRNHPPK